MGDRTARVIGGARGTGQMIARGLAAAGWRVTEPDAGPDGAPDTGSDAAPDCVALVLGGPPVSDADALDAAWLHPFRDLVDGMAQPLRDRGGAMIVVVLLPPGAGLWQQVAADGVAAGVARCARVWGQDGPRINAIIAALDDSPTLPRFLAPRPAAATQVRPADVVTAVTALCADSAAAITGQVLRIGTQP